MAAISTIIAAAALTATVYSVTEQKKQAGKQADAQNKIRNEDIASNKAKQMAERRQQIREERIKRSRVLAASEASGTVGSSGEAGAIGSMNTQLGSNVGTNQSMIQSGQRVSVFAQDAASAQLAGQQAGMFGQLVNAAAPVAGSIFSTSPSTSSGSVFDASAEQKRLQG